jgi:PAS domain S-box-containing protein
MSAKRAESPVSSDADHVSILLVDDRPENLLSLEAVLGDLAGNLVRAMSGEEALRHLLERDFAAVLLDVNMPGMGGLETARLMRGRAKSRHTPIIFLTGNDSSPAWVREAYQLGAVDYLTKPLVPEMLRAKVSVFIELFRLRANERRQAAAAIREQKQLWHATLTSIGDAVIATDIRTHVTFMNAEAERLTGWTRAEAVGQDLHRVFRIVNEETRGPMISPVGRVLETGIGVGFEGHTVLIARDGTERPIDDSAAPIKDESGTLYGVVLVFRDITERKLAEARFRRAAAEAAAAAEANAKFRVFFEQGTHFAAVMTLDGTVVEANRLSLDACGFKREEVIGKPFWECGWWNRSPELVQMVREASREAAAGRPFRTETPYLMADGSERIIDLILAPVTDDEGRVLFVAPTGTDITDRKRAEDELREAHRRKDEFLATLAHELRNPLAPIRNGLAVLRRGNPENAGRVMGIMERQLAHLVHLVDDLLDVSRVTSGKITLRKERLELHSVVDAAVETSRPLVEAAGHALTLDLPSQPLFVEADPVRLAQVLTNLINNAAKYTPAEGHISIRTALEGDQVTVAVQDDGVGLPKEMLPKIFDMFTQVGASLERSQGGLGIGLTLVRKLVEMHGGTVTAESPGAGQGSTFTVRLPLA